MDGNTRRESFIGRNRTLGSFKIGDTRNATAESNTTPDVNPVSVAVAPLDVTREETSIPDDTLNLVAEPLAEEKLDATKIDSGVEEVVIDTDKDKDGTIEISRRGSLGEILVEKQGRDNVASPRNSADVTRSKEGDSYHTFHQEEKRAIVSRINVLLRNDPDLTSVIPIDPDSMSIFFCLQDGVLLCKLINAIKPGTIPEETINKRPGGGILNQFQQRENHNISIAAAKELGCNIVNIGPDDLAHGRVHLVLGLLWQLIKIDLLSQVRSNYGYQGPTAMRGQGQDDQITTEEILRAWFNDYLPLEHKLTNFTTDLADSVCYALLFRGLAPTTFEGIDYVLEENELLKRAEMLLLQAEKIDCRTFLTPVDIVKGNQRLNIAFIANLYNHFNSSKKKLTSDGRTGGSTRSTKIKENKSEELQFLKEEVERLRKRNKELESLQGDDMLPQNKYLTGITMEEVNERISEWRGQYEVQLAMRLQNEAQKVGAKMREMTIAQHEYQQRCESLKKHVLELEELLLKERLKRRGGGEQRSYSSPSQVVPLSSQKVGAAMGSQGDAAVVEISDCKYERTESASRWVPSGGLDLSDREGSLEKLRAKKAVESEKEKEKEGKEEDDKGKEKEGKDEENRVDKETVVEVQDTPITIGATGSDEEERFKQLETINKQLLKRVEELESLLEAKENEAADEGVEARGIVMEKEKALQQCAIFRKSAAKYEAIARHLTAQLSYLEEGFESEISLAKALYGFIGSASFENPAKTGYMTKQGGSIKTWHRRYFVLQDNFLFYYKKEGDLEPKGVIHLQDYSVTELDEEELKKKHCFKVCLKKENARTYYISTDRRIEMEVWMHVIKNARKWYQSDEKFMLDEEQATKEKEKEKESEKEKAIRGKAQRGRTAGREWTDKFKLFHNGGSGIASSPSGF